MGMKPQLPCKYCLQSLKPSKKTGALCTQFESVKVSEIWFSVNMAPLRKFVGAILTESRISLNFHWFKSIVWSTCGKSTVLIRNRRDREKITLFRVLPTIENRYFLRDIAGIRGKISSRVIDNIVLSRFVISRLDYGLRLDLYMYLQLAVQSSLNTTWI